MKTVLDLINETEEAYSDPENRAISVGGSCVYQNNAGKRCAVGRCMKHPENFRARSLNAHRIFYSYDRYGIRVFRGAGYCESFPIEQEWVDEIMKEEYAGVPIEVWSELQAFHDDDEHFTKTGISEKGKDYLKRLRDAYSV